MEVTSKGIKLLFIVLLVISAVSTIRVDSQLDSMGVNYNIASMYATKGVLTQLLTVRSFPNGTRNCYTLKSLSIGSKYLVRATFMYGNYDNLNKLPIFDIHLGVNYWGIVNITKETGGKAAEIITTAATDCLQVFLINKGLGTPFISGLDLRPLETSIYKAANSTQSLALLDRLDLGASNTILRYPDDPYDRFWRNNTFGTWTKISTRSKFDPNTEFATPSAVMQTAVTTLSTEESLDYSWTSDDSSKVFSAIFHVGEIQDIPRTSLREFDLFVNGIKKNNQSFKPRKLSSGWVRYTATGITNNTVSLRATSKSTLPPLLNAFELYVITPTTGIPTYNEDVTAMNTIKAIYKVNKGWSGDPCVPTELSWTGVTCTADSTNIPRITALNLSSSGLTGAIISSFGSLRSLKSLDLSYNDLSGDLPTLDQLSALSYLDITGNGKISTTLPPNLQKRNQDGSLIFRFGNARPPSSSSNKKKIAIVPTIAAAGGVVLLLIVGAIIAIVFLKRRKSKSNIQNPNEGYRYASSANNINVGNSANNQQANAPP